MTGTAASPFPRPVDQAYATAEADIAKQAQLQWLALLVRLVATSFRQPAVGLSTKKA